MHRSIQAESNSKRQYNSGRGSNLHIKLALVSWEKSMEGSGVSIAETKVTDRRMPPNRIAKSSRSTTPNTAFERTTPSSTVTSTWRRRVSARSRCSRCTVQ